MIDYKYSELLEEIESEMELCKNFKKNCIEEMNKYKGVFDTNDKFEVKNHEFWRATILEIDRQMDFLKGLLDLHNQFKLEEVKQLEEEEENIRELKYNASLGI